jgi:putative hydrolase of the HAD superfamily
MPSSQRPPVRGVILDFGGVMTEPLFRDLASVDPDLVALVHFFLAEMQEVYHRVDGLHDLHHLETGRIGEAAFFEGVCARYAAAGNPPIDAGSARHAVFGRALIACGAMVDAVRELRAAGMRTAMLTNISRDPFTGYAEVVPVDELFDVVIDSSKVGLRKPDPAIYRLACASIGLQPEECLYVDDLVCNVEGAEGVGMTALHCRNPAETASELLERLLEARPEAVAAAS